MSDDWARLRETANRATCQGCGRSTLVKGMRWCVDCVAMAEPRLKLAHYEALLASPDPTVNRAYAEAQVAAARSVIDEYRQAMDDRAADHIEREEHQRGQA